MTINRREIRQRGGEAGSARGYYHCGDCGDAVTYSE
jgi:hypothetical protein